MERDLAAIQALDDEAHKIITTHTDEAEGCMGSADRDAEDLHRFLKDLDHFRTWHGSSSRGQRVQQIKEKIDSHIHGYTNMMEHGGKVTADPSTVDDPQYKNAEGASFKALKDGWGEVHQMWENRQTLLSQSLNLQMFNRDA